MTDTKKRMSAKKMTRGFAKIAGSTVPVYRGKRPSPAAIVREASERAPNLAARLNPQEAKFLAFYYQTGTLAAAYKGLRKGISDRSAYQRGSLLMKKIRERLSDQELFELMGVSFANITRVVTDALGATFQKDFVIPRTGEIISTEPRPDHAVRLEAAKMGAKLRKLAEENESGQVQVNIIQYSRPGDPPWPGGGREGGRFPVTINPIDSGDDGRRED